MKNEKEIFVWTICYFPFTMGGSVWRPGGCKVKASGPYDLGKGYKGYLVTAPNNTTFVSEATSGAFVGPSLESVKKDIKTGDPKLMKEQVTDANNKKGTVQELEVEKFWEMLKCL